MIIDKIKHFLKKYISDLTYGGTDGIITTFVIVASSSGANLPKIAVIIGFSSLIADSISMGASRYLALKSEFIVNQVSNSSLKPFRHALVTSVSFIFLGFIPLISFLLPIYLLDNFLLSCIFSGIALFFVGSIRGIITKNYLYAGLETMFIGLGAGMVGFFIGELFH